MQKYGSLTEEFRDGVCQNYLQDGDMHRATKEFGVSNVALYSWLKARSIKALGREIYRGKFKKESLAVIETLVLEMGSKAIPLTQGKFVLVDEEDYEYLMQWGWQITQLQNARTPQYAVRDSLRSDWPLGYKKKVKIPMHRVILGLIPGTEDDKYEVDHRDGDGLNNRRGNLRKCTRQQNTAARFNWTRDREKEKSSPYKGSCFDKERGLWISGVKYNYKRVNLGRHRTAEAAAFMYNIASKMLFGEFASLNDLKYYEEELIHLEEEYTERAKEYLSRCVNFSG